MGKSYLGVLPIWIAVGLSTLAIFAVVEIVLNCIEAPTLPPVHCGMRGPTAIVALPIYASHYVWHASVALIATVLVLRGTLRKWILTLLVPVVIFALGLSLSVSIFKIDCHRKVYGNEGGFGVCY